MAGPIDKATIANLTAGPGRCLYAPSTVARPVKLDDIITMATPYTPKTGWLEFGSTVDDVSYERDMDSDDYTIEQKSVAVLQRISDVSRTVTLPLAEVTPALASMAEGDTATAVTIPVGAAASGTPAQTRQPFGSISSLPRYRIAVIWERDRGLTGVTAEGGARGQLVAVVLYSASVAADSSELTIGRSDLPAREIPFAAFPDPGMSSSGDEVGCFLFETGATVP